MIVQDIIEHEDGSATVTFDLTPKEAKQLIEYAIKNLIKEFVNTLPVNE